MSAQMDQGWDGAEEWMPLAWELCANECGEDACTELVWEGGPVPEPWGDRWLKYEDQAKEMIAMLRKHVPALAAHEAAPQQEPDCWAILTPNGSKLVSPDEAKGRKDSYPLYAAPQQAQAPKVAVCDFVQVDDSSKSSRSQHDADSAELRSLCKARDEARRERGMLRAELAGHEASSGHLSAMVDELRALLAEAMAMMKALHESASPDDGPEMNAIVPAGAFREFVDANAALMHKIHISPHGDGAAAPQQGSNT